MITAFRRWAFGPVDTAPMAAVRIACGLITIGWVLSFLPDVPAFLADDGLTSRSAQFNYAWWHADWLIDLLTPYGTLGLLLCAAVALVLGWGWLWSVRDRVSGTTALWLALAAVTRVVVNGKVLSPP